ncbi:MAG TPA: ATP-dependent helicase HrpB [Steroidobacteraceae bacterium]|nr:ATP-dependent helicase HrpB [Steroidobacteraceae bacterium]
MAAAPRAAVPSGLPIDGALPELREVLAHRTRAVLVAEPGAGKSTVVPLALLEEPWAQGKRLIVLEPRRLAARAVAQRMASTLGESLGQRVGLRMRLETRISRATRIEVVTEGVLTRLLQEDPALEGTAALLFDEFHERSLQADLGLALALDAQALLCPALRVLIMSATLDAPAVGAWLDAAVIQVTGRLHPVATRFVGRGAPSLAARGQPRDAESLERRVARAVLQGLREEPGDVLVFLPGGAEIRRTQALLEAASEPGVRVHALYGDLPAAEQDAALAPAASGTRKVILATNIAETSLTVEGIRVVVDSGLVRRAVFDPVSGMSSLTTQRISRASAEQRRGRAGRLQPGVAYRLWSEEAHRTLASAAAAEILEADLAGLALELAAWGTRDAATLRWLDAPPPAMLSSAQDLLRRLGALDAAGRISAHGRRMAQLGTHPRLAHLLLEARERGLGTLGVLLAALLSERDLLAGAPERDADVRTRLELLRQERSAPRSTAVHRAAQTLARQLGVSLDVPAALGSQLAQVGLLLAFAYPDRIGLRRPGASGRYLLANGRGAMFTNAEPLAREELIVAADLDDREREARILLAAPLDRTALEQAFAPQLERRTEVGWSEREEGVIARETVSLEALVLEERPLSPVPPQLAREALLAGLRQLGLEVLPWTREARELQARLAFVRRLDADADAETWPASDDATLLATLEEWLSPWLEGLTRRAHLARIPLLDALQGRLSWTQRQRLDALAPTHLTVPSGTRARIDYEDENAPLVAVRLQELFGLEQSPRIGGGRVALTFRLLSPAQRPVQITRDLASFWRGGYAQVRKDLRGRYPKHYWPEDPLQAEPTRRTRPRGRPGA